eukprot:6486393-Amphidinium_carterae.4
MWRCIAHRFERRCMQRSESSHLATKARDATRCTQEVPRAHSQIHIEQWSQGVSAEAGGDVTRNGKWPSIAHNRKGLGWEHWAKHHEHAPHPSIASGDKVAHTTRHTQLYF